MSTRITSGGQPLVAVICEVPLLAEALGASLEGIADIRAFPGELDDLEGLLRSLAPDAVVVDSLAQLSPAERFARDVDVPLVHVQIREGELRILRDGVWEKGDDTGGASPEAIRNALVGGIFRRQHA